MPNWCWKQWVGAVLTGAAIAGGTLVRADDAGTLPKPNDTITMPSSGGADRKLIVVKATKKDGVVEIVAKDSQTGETITMYDAPPGAKLPAAPATPAKPPANPSSRQTDKSAATPDAPAEKRGLLGRMFGRDKTDTSTAAPTPASSAPDDTGKRPGLLNRIFGPKKPAAPVPTAAPGPVVTPPAVMTTPNRYAPIATPEPSVMPTKPFTPPPFPGRTGQTVAPTPVIPGPMPGAGAFPIPNQMPPAPTAIPVPLPAAPPGGTVPTIPLPPGAGPQTQSSVQPGVFVRSAPVQTVHTASYTPPVLAMVEDIRPYAVALQTTLAPSTRITAAKALAQGRHCSTDQVKAILFRAAQADPCPEVRADCIGHLCKLGYYHPAFQGYLKTACTDPSEEVQAAAKMALAKMTPHQR